MRLQPHLSAWLIALAGSGAVVGTGTWLLLRGRRKKTDAEKERERRLAVNAIGRMTDGTLTEALLFEGDSKSAMLFYRYSVAGVEYSAAQEISDLESSIRPGTYLPGEAITIKYDPQHPPNSIVICENWSGLHGRSEQGSDHSPARNSRVVGS